MQHIMADRPSITKAPAKRGGGKYISRHMFRCLRLSLGWSQREAADKLHMSVDGYGKIERGTVTAEYHRWVALTTAAGVPEAWKPDPDFEDRIMKELGMI